MEPRLAAAKSSPLPGSRHVAYASGLFATAADSGLFVDEARCDLQEIVDFLRNPEIPGAWGTHPARRTSGRFSWRWKNTHRPGCRGRGQRSFLHDFRLRFCRDVRWLRRKSRAQYVRGGEKKAPCIIFIDEIDAVGRHRGAGLGGGNDEREQTLNQLLVEMDGFDVNEGIILIAATNRPDVLDTALLRPGRFDRQVVVPNPDVVGREQILKVHVRKVPLARDVNLKTIARGTPGFTGADLMNLVNEAALLAARATSET